MRQHTKVAYLKPETHAALIAYCKQNGLVTQVFVDSIIRGAISKRCMARAWDGEQFINYTVDYPQGDIAKQGGDDQALNTVHMDEAGDCGNCDDIPGLNEGMND